MKHILLILLAFSGLGLCAFPGIPDTTWKHAYRNWGLTNIQFEMANAMASAKHHVVVAVVDTGVDFQHPLLMGRGEGTGWDFVTDKPNPIDTNGHGTHVAGIIASYVRPKIMSGIASNVSIISVKYYSEAATGAVNLQKTVKALNYAIDHKAQIINYSGGGPDPSKDELKALKRAEKAGILVVAAAGNESSNSDLPKNLYYPCAYRLSNIICVSGTTQEDKLMRASNWGPKFNDIAAPGEEIFSLYPRHSYARLTGTSQATAFVTGVAAMLLSENKKLTPKIIKEIILKSADVLPSLQGKVACGGRLNAYKAMQMLSASSTTQFTKPVIRKITRGE